MPFSGNRWEDSRLVPERDVLATLRRAFPGLARLAPAACDTATVCHRFRDKLCGENLKSCIVPFFPRISLFNKLDEYFFMYQNNIVFQIKL